MLRILAALLQGIDAPESNQPHGNQATAALKGLILNRRVRLEIQGTDRYDLRGEIPLHYCLDQTAKDSGQALSLSAIHY